jgi:DNA-binding IscR family transcriptional regulator
MPCGIHIAMARAEKAWREALHAQTLADIVAHYTQDVDLHQRQLRE